MSLAAILGVYLISLGSLDSGWLPPYMRGVAGQAADQHPPAVTASSLQASPNQDSAATSPPQAPPAQSPEPAKPLPSPAGQTPNSAPPAKPSPPRHHYKKAVPDCTNSPTALNTAVGKPADSTASAPAGPSDTASNHPASNNVDSAVAGSTALKPCPPPKKVVRNGGSPEPKEQLTGGTTAEQASHKRSSTEQLKAATEENLKKIEGRQLNPSQQEMVSQIKQFMQQSKTAVAGGDLERGHDLAQKAHLLSDELVKP